VNLEGVSPNRVLIKVQNVFEYALVNAKLNGWDDLRNFHYCRMPFDHVVFSWNSLHGPMQEDLHTDAVCEQIDPEAMTDWLNENQYDKDNAQRGRRVIEELQPYRLITMDMYLEGVKLDIFATVMIDEKGQLLTTPDGTGYIMNMKRGSSLSFDAVNSVATEMITVVLASINFMNCKNVEIVENQPTRQQRRLAEREGKRPPVTYRTLVIHPMSRRRWRNTGGNPAIRSGVALHICRGHFKNYSEGKGLGRGHRHGVWWWSPQLKGSERSGRIVKDYEVKER
jgi:hypothetical protein